MLAVGLLALKTALDAGGAWYGPEVTLWAYATTFVGGLILVCILLLAGVRFGRARVPEYIYRMAPSQNPTKPMERRALDDQEFEGLLESLEQVAGVSTNPQGGDPDILEDEGVRSPSVAKRSGRRRARSTLVVVLGPAITAAVFAGISAVLLPASAAGGFLVDNYTLNTTFILTFSYGWGALLLYAIASIFLASSDA